MYKTRVILVLTKMKKIVYVKVELNKIKSRGYLHYSGFFRYWKVLLKVLL